MAQWLALADAEDWESVRTVKAGIVRAEMAKAEAKANVPPCPPHGGSVARRTCGDGSGQGHDPSGVFEVAGGHCDEARGG